MQPQYYVPTTLDSQIVYTPHEQTKTHVNETGLKTTNHEQL